MTTQPSSQPTAGFLRAVILIVSDTAYRDPSTDKSGNVLRELFASEGAGKWDVRTSSDEGEDSGIVTCIVPDDIELIRKAIKDYTDGSHPVNLIAATGGTGFANRDWTPEAIGPLLHKQAPGLVHAMLAASFQVTPFAMMARPVAGVRNKTIIITLPGSPKGAKENLQAILKLLPHACQQAAGEDSRAAHVGGIKKLEKDAGVNASSTALGNNTTTLPSHHHHDHDHTHDHGHGGHRVPKAHTTPEDRPQQSNDPRLGATHRARSSPYPMLSVFDAVNKIIEIAPEPAAKLKDMNSDLVGSVVAEMIKAAEAVPAYRASIVDGYAIIVPHEKSEKTKIKGVFPVASVSHAQASSMPPPLKEGEIARITTGAPLPENANAVVMVEDTTIASTTEDKMEEATVEILTDEIEAGENVREPGSDIQLGIEVLSRGQRITSIGGEIGVLAAAGIKKVPVYARPRVGVMSTGDEVTDISYNGKLSGGMIRDSNRPSLLLLIRGWELCEEVVDLGIARDTPHSQLEEKIREAYRVHNIDVLITTGGVSMGELDLLKPTIERSMGGTIHFGRVSMKPGKPTTFASVPFKSSQEGRRSDKLIFGLPGNPASAIVTANLFLLPALQKMSGLKAKGLERVSVRVTGKIRCDKARPEYHRVVVSMDAKDGKLFARSTGMQRSSRVGSLASANALLALPQQEGYLEEGSVCDALMLGPLVGF